MKQRRTEVPVHFLLDISAESPPATQKKEHIASVLLYGCIFGLAFFGCLFLFLNVLTLPVHFLWCTAAGIVFWLVWTALFARPKGKQRLWVSMPILLVIILAVLLWQPLRQGLLRYYNCLADMLNATTYWSFPRAAMQFSAQSSATTQNTLAVCFLFFWIAMLVGYAAVERTSLLLLFFTTVIFLWAPIGFRLPVVLPAFFAVLTSYFTLYALRFSMQRQQPEGRIRKKRRSAKKYCLRPRTQTFAVIPMVVLAAILAVLWLPQQNYKRPKSMSQLRNAVMNFEWSQVDWNTLFGIRFQGFGDGDLSNLGSLNYSDRVVLKLKTETPHNTLYLHDFIGTKLEHRKWNTTSEQDYQNASASFPDLVPQQLAAMMYEFQGEYPVFWSSSFFERVPSPCGIWVRNVALPEKTAFLSSFLFMTDKTVLSFSADSMAYMRSGDEYSFQFYPIKSSIDTVFFTTERQISGVRDFYLDSAWIFADVLGISPDAQNRKGLVFADFFRQLQAYHQYLYEAYTELPEDTLQAAQELLEKYNLHVPMSEQRIDVQMAISSVRSLLQQSCRYSLSPREIPADADFTTYFLEESKEGYCVHFATAAAVLLRAMGIPTRYAEGFVLSAEDFSGERDEEDYIPIRDNRAHAWIEVYDPIQLEWIPVEMTPGFNGLQGRVNQSLRPQTSSSVPAFSSSQASSRGETPSSSRESVSSRAPVSSRAASSSVSGQSNLPPNASDRAFRWWLPLAGALLAAVFVLLLFCSICRARASLRRRGLSQRDANRAVLYGCRCLTLMLRAAGCPPPKNDDTPEGYTQKVLAVLPWLPQRHLCAALKSGQKARFAENPCSQEEQEGVTRLVEELLTMIPNQMAGLRAVLFRVRFPR